MYQFVEQCSIIASKSFDYKMNIGKRSEKCGRKATGLRTDVYDRRVASF